MTKVDYSKGCLTEAMEILETCAEARRIYRALDPYAMADAFGERQCVDDNLIMCALWTEKAVGRMLTHTTADSRERCMKRILKSEDLKTVRTLIEVLPKYERVNEEVSA